MGITIEDGKGSGRILGVDAENRAMVSSVQQSMDFHINEKNGKVWSLPFGPQDPAGANDYVFYLKNTGSKDISVTDIRLSATGAASRIEINDVTGTAASGSTITPVARNLGSSQTLSATAEEGTDITGLTSGGTLFYMELAVVSTLYHIRTTSNIIIPKNSAIGILVATATSIVTGVVSVLELE